MITRLHQHLATEGEEKTARETILEERYGDAARQWVKKRNRQTIERFAPLQKSDLVNDVASLLKRETSAHRLRGNYVDDFEQGWRRTTLQEYQKPDPDWEMLIDLHDAAQVKKWNACLSDDDLANHPDGLWDVIDILSLNTRRHLAVLSYSGSDDCLYYEFDEQKKKFIDDGFVFWREYTSYGQHVAWGDENTLLIEDVDAERGNCISVWARDAESVAIHRLHQDTWWAYLETHAGKQGHHYHLVTQVAGYHNYSYALLSSRDFFSIQKLDIPGDATVAGFIFNAVIFTLGAAWQGKNGIRYPADSVLSLDLAPSAIPKISLIFESTDRCVVKSVVVTDNNILICALNQVKAEVYQLYWRNGWRQRKLALPADGDLDIIPDQTGADVCLVRYENFITPETDYFCDLTTGRIELIKQADATFDASNMTIQQYWATSLDETRIPYFAVHLKSVQYHGMNPTVLHGYGAHGISQLPGYLPNTGKLWLEKGGVYLSANIRGGKEFGVRWHTAILQEHRHKCFEDFIAVAEDAIRRGITSPDYLGIRGGSMGGLLVAASFVQRPDLFKAVICEVPMLDMLNYNTHKMENGVWVDECGHPEQPVVRNALRRYSPYHTVSPDSDYPEVLFFSATNDERIHPAHARKMVDRMTRQGHKVYYYEYSEGGHHSGHDLLSVVLQFTYLYQKLMPPKSMLSLAPTEREIRYARRHALFARPEDAPVSEDVGQTNKRQKMGL